MLLDAGDLEVSYKNKPSDKEFTFIVRKMLEIRLYGEVFWTPFEKLNLVLRINIRTIDLVFKGKKVVVKFNFIDHDNTLLKFSYSDDRDFGIYSLAPG